MLRKIIFVALTFFGFISCSRLSNCSDEELSFARIADNSSSLDLRGYYYGAFNVSEPTTRLVLALNNNGVMRSFWHKSIEEIEANQVNLDLSGLAYDYKGDWGVFDVKGGELRMDYWLSQINGCVTTIQLRGEVVSDTSFRILHYRYGLEESFEPTDAMFYLKAYSPKPDSVVSFIP